MVEFQHHVALKNRFFFQFQIMSILLTFSLSRFAAPTSTAASLGSGYCQRIAAAHAVRVSKENCSGGVVMLLDLIPNGHPRVAEVCTKNIVYHQLMDSSYVSQCMQRRATENKLFLATNNRICCCLTSVFGRLRKLKCVESTTKRCSTANNYMRIGKMTTQTEPKTFN